MIIDCHTHCYPETVSANPRQWASQRGEWHWRELVAPEGGKSIQDWATPSEMLRTMDEAGVEKSVLLGWYWENESTCRWHNEVIAQWCETAPDRFIGFASIFPNENVLSQLEQARRSGLRGVGELHPGVQGFHSQSRHWKQLASWCEAEGWPINFHTTRPARDHPAAIQTPLEDYIAMAREFPELTFIFAHWGGGIAEQLSSCTPANIYFDCSASPLMYSSDIFRKTIKSAGLEKILYGSDYPLRIFPRKFKRAEMAHYIKLIKTEAELSEAEIYAILSQNARRLLTE